MRPRTRGSIFFRTPIVPHSLSGYLQAMGAGPRDQACSQRYRGEWKITIGSKGLFCDLESTRRVCLCTLYPKPSPSKAISCVLSPKMNSPAHLTCDFMVKFGAENGHFWHISLFWHVAQIRGSMLKKIAQIRDTRANQVRYWSVQAPSHLEMGTRTPQTPRGDIPRDVTSEAKTRN